MQDNAGRRIELRASFGTKLELEQYLVEVIIKIKEYKVFYYELFDVLQ